MQDLYAALNGPGQMLVFCDYERCHPGFLNTLAALAQTGSAPLNSRYAVQKGMLVDVGTALVPDAVSALSPRGKYLVFLSGKGPEKMADRMGAGVVNALSDVCATRPFTEEELEEIAARGLEQLTEHAARQLKLTVTANEEFLALARRQASPGRGAAPSGNFLTGASGHWRNTSWKRSRWRVRLLPSARRRAGCWRRWPAVSRWICWACCGRNTPVCWMRWTGNWKTLWALPR